MIELIGREHSFIDQGSARERRNVELFPIGDIGGLNLIFKDLANNEQAPFKSILNLTWKSGAFFRSTNDELFD